MNQLRRGLGMASNATASSSSCKSDTFHHAIGFPIQCFTMNKNASKIIVAGKNQCELFDIDEHQFSFKSRFILNRNLCIMDICWSHLDENLVVSCGSNCELYKFNITQTGDLALDLAFRFHERTINKIAFHPNEKHIFISGGQDGIIKLMDFRKNNDQTVLVFKQDPEDRVTDVQFNPSESMKNQFASGSEGGSVYIWDYRNPNSYERRLQIPRGDKHVHLDWHPEEKYWLATGSKKGQICVYDLRPPTTSEKPPIANPIHTLTHSESVTSVKWRPNRPTQITACGNGYGAHLSVWDLTRPYVPYASFDTLTSMVHSFMWRSSKVLVASTTSRNCIYNISINEAIRPTDYANLVSVQMDNFGSVAFSVGVEDPKLIASNPTSGHTEKLPPAAPLLLHSEPIPSLSSAAIPIACGSFSSISLNMHNLFDTQSNDSDNLNERFRITKSNLYFDTSLKETRSDWFYYAANNYKFKDDNFEALCEKNAQVALDYQRFNVYKDWMILKTIFKDYQKSAESASINTNNNNTNNNVNSSNNANYREMLNSNSRNGENVLGLQIQINQQQQNNLMNVSNSSLAGGVGAASGSSSTSALSSSPSSSSSGAVNTPGLRHFSDENSTDELLITGANNYLINEQTQTQNSNTTSNNSNQTKLNQQFENLESLNNLMSILSTEEAPLDDESIYLASTKPAQQQKQQKKHPSNKSAIQQKQKQVQQQQVIQQANIQLYQAQDNDDEDFSILPSDIIEYNDELSDDYFLNERNFKTLFNEDLMAKANNNNNFKYESFRDLNILNSVNGGVSLGSANNRLNAIKSDLLIESLSLNQQANSLDLKMTNDLNTDDNLASSITGTTNTANTATTSNTSTILPAINTKAIGSDFLSVDLKDYFQDLLVSYVNEENDLTTAVFMYLVASLNSKLDKCKIDSVCLDEWFSQYIELLAKFELWNLRIEIIKNYQSEFIRGLTQNSLMYNPMCGACKKTLRPNTFYCPNCKINNFLCVYCHLPVKRLYAWCHSCCHGGHLSHLIKWFKKNAECPSGCGCRCRI